MRLPRPNTVGTGNDKRELAEFIEFIELLGFVEFVGFVVSIESPHPSGNVPLGYQVVSQGFLPGPHVVHAQEAQVVVVQHRVAGPTSFLWVLVGSYGDDGGLLACQPQYLSSELIPGAGISVGDMEYAVVFGGH